MLTSGIYCLSDYVLWNFCLSEDQEITLNINKKIPLAII